MYHHSDSQRSHHHRRQSSNRRRKKRGSSKYRIVDIDFPWTAKHRRPPLQIRTAVRSKESAEQFLCSVVESKIPTFIWKLFQRVYGPRFAIRAGETALYKTQDFQAGEDPEYEFFVSSVYAPSVWWSFDQRLKDLLQQDEGNNEVMIHVVEAIGHSSQEVADEAITLKIDEREAAVTSGKRKREEEEDEEEDDDEEEETPDSQPSGSESQPESEKEKPAPKKKARTQSTNANKKKESSSKAAEKSQPEQPASAESSTSSAVGDAKSPTPKPKARLNDANVSSMGKADQSCDEEFDAEASASSEDEPHEQRMEQETSQLGNKEESEQDQSSGSESQPLGTDADDKSPLKRAEEKSPPKKQQPPESDSSSSESESEDEQKPSFKRAKTSSTDNATDKKTKKKEQAKRAKGGKAKPSSRKEGGTNLEKDLYQESQPDPSVPDDSSTSEEDDEAEDAGSASESESLSSNSIPPQKNATSPKVHNPAVDSSSSESETEDEDIGVPLKNVTIPAKQSNKRKESSSSKSKQTDAAHEQKPVVARKRKRSDDRDKTATPKTKSQIKREEIWQTRFKELQEFKKQHGHCKVPSSRSSLRKEDKQLGRWVETQRKLGKTYPDSAMTEEHHRALDEIGFVWSARAGTSSKKSQEGQQGDNVGTTPPPSKRQATTAKGSTKRRPTSKTGEKEGATVKELSKEKSKSKQAERENETEESEEDEGTDSSDDSDSKVDSGKSGHNKDAASASKKKESRIASSEDEGEQEEASAPEAVQGSKSSRGKVSWDENFAQLVEYQKKHGHCKVPYSWKENPTLGRWVRSQRDQGKKYPQSRSMTKARYEALDGLGFVWAVERSAGWEHNFKQLVEYQKKYGHCQVPYDWKENPSLGRWVMTQQKESKNYPASGALTKEKYEALADLGFEFDIKSPAKSPASKLSMMGKDKEDDSQSSSSEPRDDGVLEQAAQKKGTTKKTSKSASERKEPGTSREPKGAKKKQKEKKKKKSKAEQAEDAAVDDGEEGDQDEENNNDENSRAGDNRDEGIAGKRKKPASATKKKAKASIASSEDEEEPERPSTPKPPREVKATPKPPKERKPTKFDKRWDEKFRQLAVFKNVHGHCKVPQSKKYPELGRWVAEQRMEAKKYPESGRMTRERYEALDSIGFDWSCSTWEKHLKELVEFKEQHGHCNVPKGWTENPSLSYWVAQQRRNGKKYPESGSMTKERYEALDELGFVWTPVSRKASPNDKESNADEVSKSAKSKPETSKEGQTTAESPQKDSTKPPNEGSSTKFDRQWQEKFNELAKFKEQHGHCEVPKGWKENHSLAIWVENQRRFGKKYPQSGPMTKERHDMLDELGFEWNVKRGQASKASPNEEDSDSEEVPKSAKSKKKTSKEGITTSKSLQKGQATQKSPREGKATKLDSQWQDKFNELVEFKKQHGHCKVPQAWKQNPALGKWVMHQRQHGKGYPESGPMTKERYEALDGLGFVWTAASRKASINEKQSDAEEVPKSAKSTPTTPTEGSTTPKPPQKDNPKPPKESKATKFERQWQDKFNQLAEFKKQHGHCKVPKGWKENPSLGIWVENQRRNGKKYPESGPMTKERYETLNRLGFVWIAASPKASANDEDSDSQDVPKSAKSKEETSKEAITTSKSPQKGQATPKPPQERKATKFDRQWQDKFHELVEFKKQHGHTKVPQAWKQNPALGKWVTTQRQHGRAYPESGSMTKERHDMLVELGFEWNVKRDPVKSWDEQFNALKEFKKKHGHCHVPGRFEENISLAGWVKKQRRERKKGEMSQEHYEALHKLGFIWDLLKPATAADIERTGVIHGPGGVRKAD